MTRLVGRAPELRQLLAAISRVENGRSETIVIDGDPGIGKTRLLSELATQAQALGWAVENLESTRIDADDVLEGHLTELGVAGRKAPGGLIKVPTVLIIDDAHLLHETALKALVALGERRNVSLMTIASFRSAGEVVRAFRSELDKQKVPTITLSALSENDSLELATAVFGSELPPEAVSHLEIANGNPRLICELMRTVNAPTQDFSGAGSQSGGTLRLEQIRHNLPLILTPLIGRDTEVAQLREVLKTERLVTIAGAGGCGKTRLAIELGHQLLEGEMGHVLWIELALLSDSSGCASALATALGVSQLSVKHLVAGILDALRMSDVSFIVIDNVEHLIEATAAMVSTILVSVPTVKIICTSREPLGAPSELVWRLPSLSFPLPNPGLAASEIGSCDAVRLFVDRAMRVQRGFSLTNQNAPAIANICARLDGLPLAIELAAARMSLMAPERIAEQLNDRFRLLAGGSRTAVPRQQTLQASVAWSEGLLDDQDRAVFRRLGVFVGGFVLEAAAGVAALFGDVEQREVSESLGRLVNKSLVNFDERLDRYTMLETIRTFALQRLIETNEITTAREAHAQWYATWLEGLNAFIYGGTMQDFVDRSGVMSHRIDLDRPNCYAALEWVVPGSECSLRICGGLGYYWILGQNGADSTRFSEPALLDGDHLSSVWLHAFTNLTGVLSNADSTIIERLSATVRKQAYESGEARMILRDDYHMGWNLSLNGPTSDQVSIATSLRQRGNDLGDWYVVLNTTVLVAMSLAIGGRVSESLDLLGEFEHHRTLLTEAACLRHRGDFARAAALLAPVDAYLAGLPSASGEIVLQTMAAAELALLTQDGSHLLGRRFTGGHVGYAGTIDPSRLMATGLLHLVEGDLRSARDAFATTSQFLAGGRSSRWLCQVEAANGEGDKARQVAVELIERWKHEITPAFDASAFLVIGECDLGTDIASALTSMHQSLSVASQFSLWPAVVDALEGIGSVLVGGGRMKDGSRLLAASTAARDRMGYRYRFAHRDEYVLAAQDLAAQHLVAEDVVASDFGCNVEHDGEAAMSLPEAVLFAQRMRGTRIKATVGWDSLTPTELQVIALVAIGLTNPQVAERLFMSRSTVKTHLVHVYDKLNISTRTELAAEVTRRS